MLRHVDRADPEVLLISSTRKANTWVIPKGGWERDEVNCLPPLPTEKLFFPYNGVARFPTFQVHIHYIRTTQK